MPGNLSISSHGHCYHVLIISHLVKAGISRSDDEIDSCLNFAEHLAYEMRGLSSDGGGIGQHAFEEFVEKYKNTYLLKESTLNRMCDHDYGIISRADGRFRNPYMYYYFLGRFLAKYADKHKDIIDQMLERSYVRSNCLTLIFIIHHTSDNKIIEDIVFVGSQKEMNDVALFVHKRRPALGLDRIRNAIRMLAFIWTMGNMETIVEVLNKPEIRELVEEVVDRKKTAAYDVIGWFLRLDTAQRLTSDDRKRLRSMLRQYKYPFLERVLSLRTQRYLNTHRVRESVEQAICADLKIKYRPRLKAK